MSDLDYIHPEFVKRYTRLVEWCWANNWAIGISSGSRSYNQQVEWYRQYRAGTWPYGLVADPNTTPGKSPWGWWAHGSLHMIQEDGWSHALDLWWIGPTNKQVHDKAWQLGIRFVEPTEAWHAQWWDYRDGLFPVYEEDDMTADEFAKATGLTLNPDNPWSGQYGVNLLETMDNDGNATYKWYPYGEAIKFIHQELKMRRLKNQ